MQVEGSDSVESGSSVGSESGLKRPKTESARDPSSPTFRGRGRGRGRDSSGGRYFRALSSSSESAEKGAITAAAVVDTPTMAMFRAFQRSMDDLADTRERIVKVSRDITIESKRVIFLLHRVTGADADRVKVLSEAGEKLRDVRQRFRQVSREARGPNYFRFQRNFTDGAQEYVEALSFYEYLKTGQLVTVEQINAEFLSDQEEAGDSETMAADHDACFRVSMLDYLMGVCDLTGELMRYAINLVAAGDLLTPFEVLQHLHAISRAFAGQLTPQIRTILSKKLTVMQASVVKVEQACYAVQVRGSEYPKEMLAEFLQQQDVVSGGGGEGDT